MHRTTIQAIVAAVIMLAYFCAPSTASADGVTWDLSGVTFSDGSTASGSFVFDATTDQITDVDITTTAGTAFTGATYVGENPGFGGGSYFGPTFYQLVFSTNPSDPSLGAPLLVFYSVSDGFPNLAPGGEIVLDNSSGEFTCGNATCSEVGSTIRSLTGGAIIAAAEPSSLALLAVGLAGLMLVGKRKVFQA